METEVRLGSVKMARKWQKEGERNEEADGGRKKGRRWVMKAWKRKKKRNLGRNEEKNQRKIDKAAEE